MIDTGDELVSITITEPDRDGRSPVSRFGYAGKQMGAGPLTAPATQCGFNANGQQVTVV